MKNQANHVRAVWVDELPDDEWEIYRDVLHGANERGTPFALAGAFALAAYTHHWRDTKDLDLCVQPRDRQAMIDTLNNAEFNDYYDQKPYDRAWIFRGVRDGVIVDVIWAMANQRAQVDESWFCPDTLVEARGEEARVISPEVILWDKLYILQRDRSDWPDAMNLLEAVGDQLDWRNILRRTGEDAPLLAGLLSVFRWVSPGRARAIPEWVWRQLGLQRPPASSAAGPDRRHVRWLDSRPWFFPHETPPEPVGEAA
jgi:hypothetical protein